jgi:hypothetical protein
MISVRTTRTLIQIEHSEEELTFLFALALQLIKIESGWCWGPCSFVSVFLCGAV